MLYEEKILHDFLAVTRGSAGEVFLPFTRQSPLSDEGIHAVPVGTVGGLGFPLFSQTTFNSLVPRRRLRGAVVFDERVNPPWGRLTGRPHLFVDICLTLCIMST